MESSKLERRSRCFAHQFQSLPCFEAADPKLEMTLVPSLLMMRCTCACMEAAAKVIRRMAARRIEREIVARALSSSAAEATEAKPQSRRTAKDLKMRDS